MVDKMPGDAGGEQRRRAAEAALEDVRPGMKLGLGSGRTAELFVRALAERVRGGLLIVGVPTSAKTAELARAEGIPLATLDEEPVLDLVVDGADEVDPALRLIKGGGGALLREKIVASTAKRMIVVVDSAKVVEALGAFPLPVEVVPFGRTPVRRAIENAASRLGLSGSFAWRQSGGGPYVTDGGNHILDVSLGRIDEPERLAQELDAMPGVVEHGLFIGFASLVIVAGSDGITRLSK
jgi:ribose 5-phosphate isomerase A